MSARVPVAWATRADGETVPMLYSDEVAESGSVSTVDGDARPYFAPTGRRKQDWALDRMLDAGELFHPDVGLVPVPLTDYLSRLPVHCGQRSGAPSVEVG